MSSRLEQFIKDHREEFDSEEPSKKVWENIPTRKEPAEKQPATIVRINIFRWSAAAAVVILLSAGSLWYFKYHKDTASTETATVKKETPKDTSSSVAKTPVSNGNDTSANQVAQSTTNPDNDTKAGSTMTDDVTEEMYHYAKLVEIKHKELKKIEKDEPLLYKQFSSDVKQLDSVYHTLQKQLPKNPNREQLLEAMIQNLQLQIGLLNHQLDIIKQINQKKQSAYEKAYKSA
jgi:hypothetical protein